MVGKGSNNKGTIDVFLLKHHILEYLTVAFPTEQSMNAGFLKDTLAKISTHKGYRDMSGYTADRKELSWWAKLPQSGRKLYELIEDLVYKTTFDHVIKQVLRNNATNSTGMVQEVLTTNPVKDSMSEIHTALAEEKPVVKPPENTEGLSPPGVETGRSTANVVSGNVSVVQVAGVEIPNDLEDKLKPWLDFAEKLVSQWVTLCVEPDSGSQIGDLLKQTNLPDMHGTSKTSYVLVYYDVKQAGTASSSAHIRHPNFRQDHLRKCIVGFQEARASADELNEGDLFMILDAQAHGNHASFASAFNKLSEPKPMNKSKTIYYLNYDEESLKVRKTTNREVKIDQVEQAVVFTPTVFQLQGKARKHFNSSNLGNAIFPIAMPRYETTWRLPPDVRRQLFGKRGVVLTGGACEGSYDPPSFQDGMEPVNWFAMSENWYAEVLHSWNVKFVVHFTALEDSFALMCIRNKIGYVGMVNSDEHKKLLRARLVTRVFEDLSTEGGPNYQATCAALMKEAKGNELPTASGVATAGGAHPPKAGGGGGGGSGSGGSGGGTAPKGKAAPKAPSGGENPLAQKRLEILDKLRVLNEANTGGADAAGGEGGEPPAAAATG